jgi:RimJ/RimL family protein N-acetyltransferase
MQVFLETERLILRQFIEEHADNLFKLDSDPEVMRFINRGLQQLERKAVKDGVSKDEFQL